MSFRRHGLPVQALVSARKVSYKVSVPEFRILGPLEVLAADGEPLALGGQKQRAVLALLLLRANHVVATDFLIDALWGDNPPRTATTSLQNSISALRKVLGPDVLLTQAPGYRLLVEDSDLGRFERLVEEARGLEPEERAERLRQALALWRGDPLPEFSFEDFAEADIRGLDELRLTTLEERIDADLAAGRSAELVPELVALVAQQPLRERLRAQLMLAHYHSGRQDDALRIYQEGRRALAELGLEPSPALQELETKILRQDGARPGAEPRAQGAGDEDPPPGGAAAAPRDPRRRRGALRGGRRGDPLGTRRAGARCGRRRARRGARRPLRLLGKRPGPDAGRAVRRADEGG